MALGLLLQVSCICFVLFDGSSASPTKRGYGYRYPQDSYNLGDDADDDVLTLTNYEQSSWELSDDQPSGSAHTSYNQLPAAQQPAQDPSQSYIQTAPEQDRVVNSEIRYWEQEDPNTRYWYYKMSSPVEPQPEVHDFQEPAPRAQAYQEPEQQTLAEQDLTPPYQEPALTYEGQAPQVLTYQEPATQTPTYQEEALAYQEPAAQALSYQEPAYPIPAYGEPEPQAPAYQEPLPQVPVNQQPALDDQDPAAQALSHQEPASQTPAYGGPESHVAAYQDPDLIYKESAPETPAYEESAQPAYQEQAQSYQEPALQTPAYEESTPQALAYQEFLMTYDKPESTYDKPESQASAFQKPVQTFEGPEPQSLTFQEPTPPIYGNQEAELTYEPALQAPAYEKFIPRAFASQRPSPRVLGHQEPASQVPAYQEPAQASPDSVSWQPVSVGGGYGESNSHHSRGGVSNIPHLVFEEVFHYPSENTGPSLEYEQGRGLSSNFGPTNFKPRDDGIPWSQKPVAAPKNVKAPKVSEPIPLPLPQPLVSYITQARNGYQRARYLLTHTLYEPEVPAPKPIFVELIQRPAPAEAASPKGVKNPQRPKW